MPTYSIEGPDGKTYSIDGPAGATREQVIAKIKEKQATAPADMPTSYDPLAASAGVAPAGTPTIDKLFTGPSWAQKATEQSQRDREAFARGGVREMLKDTEGTQELAGGFSDAGIAGSTKGIAGAAAKAKPPVALPPAPKPGPFGIVTPKGPIPADLTAPSKAHVGAFEKQAQEQIGTAQEAILRSFDPPREVVYHGTGRTFKDFDTRYSSHPTGAIFFSDSPQEAGKFGGGKNIIPANLNLNNPMHIDARGALYNTNKMNDALRAAQDAGHDGLIISNIKNFAQGRPTTTYAVFDPKKISRQLQGGQIRAETAPQMGALVQEGFKSSAEALKATEKAAYKRAEAMPGAVDVNTAQGIPQRIWANLNTPGKKVNITNLLTPHASEAINYVDHEMERVIDLNKTQPVNKALNAPPGWTGVNLGDFNEIGKELNVYYRRAFKSGNEADVRAMNRIIDAFRRDVSQMTKSPAYLGDPRAAKAYDMARNIASEYSNTFRSSGTGTPSDIIETIIGGNKNAPTIPEDVADYIIGSTNKVNPDSLNVAVIREAKRVLGPQSEAMIGVRQFTLRKLMTPVPGEWKPVKTADRIVDFLDNSKAMADELYSPQYRQVLRNFAGVLRSLEPQVAGAAQQSGPVAAMAGKIAHGLGELVVHTFGLAGLKRPARFGVGLAKAAGAAAMRVAKGERQVEDLAKQLPLLRDEIAKWQAAVQKAQRSNTSNTRQAAYVATLSLQSTLRKMGVPNIGMAGAGPPQEQTAGGKTDKLGFQGPMQ